MFACAPSSALPLALLPRPKPRPVHAPAEAPVCPARGGGGSLWLSRCFPAGRRRIVTSSCCVLIRAVLKNPIFVLLRTALKDTQPPTATNRHQPPPTARNRQPPTIVQYCFCGPVSCPCLDHEAESARERLFLLALRTPPPPLSPLRTALVVIACILLQCRAEQCHFLGAPAFTVAGTAQNAVEVASQQEAEVGGRVEVHRSHHLKRLRSAARLESLRSLMIDPNGHRCSKIEKLADQGRDQLL